MLTTEVNRNTGMVSLLTLQKQHNVIGLTGGQLDGPVGTGVGSQPCPRTGVSLEKETGKHQGNRRRKVLRDIKPSRRAEGLNRHNLEDRVESPGQRP